MSTKHEVAVELAGGKRLVFETGRMAKQASGAALVTTGETVVLATAVASPDPREGIDFFPLTVDYREYTYAGGRIPGGFIKREGRPSEKEVLTCRQIDRPIRPLFPDGFRNETQVIALVFSADKENDPDVVGINAAAAPWLSPTFPFSATVGAVRVGRVNGEFVINPTYSERAATTVNIMVVGHKDGIVMIESGAKEETEEVILAAIEFAHTEIKKIVAAIDELVALAGKPKRAFTAPEFDEAYYAELKAKIGDRLKDALDTKTHGKTESYALIKQIKDELAAELPEDDPAAKKKLAHYYEHLRERTFREQVTKDRIRPDRRAFDEIREITIETGVLPRTRLGPVHPRRDPGPGYGHAGHAGRRPAPGELRRRAAQELHAPLQLPAVQRWRNRPHGRHRPARDRPRSTCRARHFRGSAQRRGIALLHPHRLRHSRVQRLFVDGLGLRRQPGALRLRHCQLKGSVAGVAMGWSRKATTTPSLPTLPARKITTATWTSRWPAPARASPPCRWTSRSAA
jgi:ribonuclease PH